MTKYHMARLVEEPDPENKNHLTNKINIKEHMGDQEQSDPISPRGKDRPRSKNFLQQDKWVKLNQNARSEAPCKKKEEPPGMAEMIHRYMAEAIWTWKPPKAHLDHKTLLL